MPENVASKASFSVSEAGIPDGRGGVVGGLRYVSSVRTYLLAGTMVLAWAGAGSLAMAQSPGGQAETEAEAGADGAVETSDAEEVDQQALYYGNGIRAFRNEDYEEAIEWFTKGTALNDGDARWYADRAGSYAMLQRFDEAEADYGRAIAAVRAYSTPTAWTRAILHYNRGNARHRAGDFRGALADYERVVELDTDEEFSDVHNAMGFLLATAPDAEIRDGERALRVLKVALERSADKSERRVHALDSQACAYAELGRFDEAVVTMETCLALADELELEADAVAELRERAALFRAQEPYRFDGLKQAETLQKP